ncbi:hypothetical protein L1987_57165 [Smallanthus sonchifolius]|uniref:Uncharacterized protein n=1 Tax=Smallanthus sonchifolius TaxID=185202 RepID=A0ACB9DC15_9ASTR|nr:hypothetical protein L1987_57165 [Smallanthus sonchifolius]
MTPESVLVYLDLPSTILMAEEFQSLTVTDKQFYAVHYKDITKFVARLFTHDTSSVVFGPDDTEQNRNHVLLRHILVLRAVVAKSTSQAMALRAELLVRADQNR